MNHNIAKINVIPLVGVTPKGGWMTEVKNDDNLHTLIEIHTVDGLTGIGSVFTSANLVCASLDLLCPLLVGESAIEPQKVSEKLSQATFWQGRGGAVTHTISGIDLALWDILGKATAQPVGRLLGGIYHNKVRPYGSLLMSSDNQMEKDIEDALSKGFKAIKLGWGPFGRVSDALDEKIIRRAKKALGDNIDLMIDAGGSDQYWEGSYKWALKAATMLASYDVKWFDEPLRPNNLEGFIRLTEHAPLPISGCEVLTRRESFLPWIEKHAIDYIQPDVTKVGGLSTQLRIAQLAYDHSIKCIPHGWNTVVGLHADLHLVSALPSKSLVEYLPSPYIDGLVKKPFQIDSDGYLDVPSTPGLGVDWDQEAIKSHSGETKVYTL